MNNLEQLKKNMQDDCYGEDSTDNRTKGLCIDCKNLLFQSVTLKQGLMSIVFLGSVKSALIRYLN